MVWIFAAVALIAIAWAVPSAVGMVRYWRFESRRIDAERAARR